jgi:Domain of unknown function (DUF4398)
MTRMHRKIHGWCLVGLTATLTACATVPPPVQLMDRAQAEIRAARNAGAAMTAPEVLAEAERRMAAAQQFAANGDNDKATDSAEEAEAAAATAQARAEAAQLDGQIQQQTTLNATLRADLQRRQAAAAAAQQAVVAPPPAPAPASSSSLPVPASTAGSAPVTLPSIQLGQPAPGTSAGSPAPAPSASSGEPDSGSNP